MKKTLIISLEFPPQIGGIATYVHDFAKNLDNKQVVVLAPVDKTATDWDNQQPYKINRKKLLFHAPFWPRWLRLIFIVYRLCKKEGIEIILIHQILPVGYVGIIMKKLKKIPFLIFFHGTDVFAATKSRWKTKMTSWICSRAEQLIFNSQSLKKRLSSIIEETELKSIVLRPCPDSNLLNPPPEAELKNLRQIYALEGKQVLLTVSRFVEGKGFPHLIRLINEVIKVNPNIIWLIIGSGPKEKEILAGIQKNNLQNIARFIGPVCPEKLKPFYYVANLFILLTHPDENKLEGAGLVFLEAAAAGLPVIAGRSGGVEEIVLHAETGLIFDVYQQFPMIKEAILELLRNHEYAKRLGTQAQERVRAEFEWKKQIKQLSWLSNKIN